jgi:hypothetical protein
MLLRERLKDWMRFSMLMLPSVYGFVLVGMVILGLGAYVGGRDLAHLVAEHLWPLLRHLWHR